MSPTLRLAVLGIVFALGSWLCVSTGSDLTGRARAQATPTTRGDDKVYQYKGRDGRQVYTNAGAVSIHGKSVEPLALPELRELHEMDFARASGSQLQQLDRGVQRAHEELQTGRRCQAIRASLRVSASTFLWREHLRELMVSSALLAIALVVMLAWGGPLKRLMPLAPLLGCAYLGYATYARIDRRIGALRDGLHACSSDLPPSDNHSPNTIKQRLASAYELQATIDRAYAQRAELSESVLRER